MQVLQYQPQITFDSIIRDTVNWVEIQGTFLASGGEKFITIGNFYADSNTLYDSVTNNFNGYSYYYFDDISIYQKTTANAGNDQTICLGDSIQIGSSALNGIIYRWNTASGLSDSTAAQPFAKPLQTTTYYLTIADTGNLYCAGALVDSVTITVNDCTPPPVYYVPTILWKDELFFVSALPVNTALELYDERGRLILNETNYKNDFSVVGLNAGIYFYRLNFADGTSQRGKICVVK
jgi:hypothetical protein